MARGRCGRPTRKRISLSRVKVLIGRRPFSAAFPTTLSNLVEAMWARLVTLLGRSCSGGDAAASIEGCSGHCGWLAHPPTGGSGGDATLA
jgi:hypothetical protein